MKSRFFSDMDNLSFTRCLGVKIASYLVLTALFVFFSNDAFSQEKRITLEQIWDEGYFVPKGIRMGKSMNDGLRYSIVEKNTEINVYDYARGEFLDRIFSTEGLLEDENGEVLFIDDYIISPDETRILIGVNQESIYRHSRMAEYYIWDIGSEKLEALSDGGKQRLPDFSPDGTKVAFVRKNNIFIKDIISGEEKAITSDGKINQIINGATDWVYEEEFGFAKGFYWSPDSKRIAYYKFDESEVREFMMLLYGDLYPEEYRFKYPKAGEKNSDVSIHIYNVESQNTIKVNAEGYEYIPRIKWTTDPGRLAVMTLNRHQNNLEILLADDSGQTAVLYNENNLYYIKINDDLTFLEDGRHFIISSEKSGFNHLYLYNMDGKEVKALTSGGWDVQRFLGVDERNKRIFYLSHESSVIGNDLYSVKLNGRGKKKLTQGSGTNSPQFSKGFKFFVNTWSAANHPPVISIYDSEGERINVLQDNQQLVSRLNDFSYTDKEFFTITTEDNVELNAWMIKPMNFDPEKQYPVLMYVYGGPGSQTVVNRWDVYNGIWFQMLSQMGFVVVSVDNRGTGARGEYFKKMTYMELGKYETIDQIQSAKFLAGLPYVDGQRISIFGWSYGGYLSSLCLARGAEHFAAAIAVAPVANWRFYDTVYTERYMRTPEENPEGYDNNSPVNHVEKIKGELLLVHGSADDNVHFQNTMEMTNALIEADVPFEMMAYPNQNHSIFGGNSRLHLYRKMTDFLNRNLSPGKSMKGDGTTSGNNPANN